MQSKIKRRLPPCCQITGDNLPLRAPYEAAPHDLFSKVPQSDRDDAVQGGSPRGGPNRTSTSGFIQIKAQVRAQVPLLSLQPQVPPLEHPQLTPNFNKISQLDGASGSDTIEISPNCHTSSGSDPDATSTCFAPFTRRHLAFLTASPKRVVSGAYFFQDQGGSWAPQVLLFDFRPGVPVDPIRSIVGLACPWINQFNYWPGVPTIQ